MKKIHGSSHHQPAIITGHKSPFSHGFPMVFPMFSHGSSHHQPEMGGFSHHVDTSEIPSGRCPKSHRLSSPGPRLRIFFKYYVHLYVDIYI